MKTTTKAGAVFLFLMIVCTLAARAQNDEISLAQSLWGMEKRQIVTEYMKLTDVEATGFWKEYDAYEAERKELGKQRLLLIKDYADHYTTLTDAKATELVKKV